MKLLLIFFTLLISQLAYSQELSKDSLIESWQSFQVEGEFIDTLEQIDTDLFNVKFSNLPYEGKLKILFVNIEELDLGNGITAYGSVEVDLVDAESSFLQRYESVFFKWKQSNSFYFNSDSETWINYSEYNELLKLQPQHEQSWFWSLLKFWNVLIVFIILYFFISQILNNRKIKKSVKFQEESLKLQKLAVEQSIELHKETNMHLKELRNELKQ